MRDRWLRDVFAVGLSSPSEESKEVDEQQAQTILKKTCIDEEEAIRLLIDYGISEEKVKVRLQVSVK